jgi:hypothetical protein
VDSVYPPRSYALADAVTNRETSSQPLLGRSNNELFSHTKHPLGVLLPVIAVGVRDLHVVLGFAERLLSRRLAAFDLTLKSEFPGEDQPKYGDHERYERTLSSDLFQLEAFTS